MSELFNLKGKVSVITGAAGGLGLAMAKELVAHGSDIAIVDVQEEKAKAAAAELSKQGVHAEAYYCNIADRKQVFELADKIKADFGKVDVLVNNAGVFQGDNAAVETMDFETEWRRIMSTNLDGTFSMCQAFGKMMIEAGSGSIIINASKSGVVPDVPNKQTAYNVAKAGLIMLVKSLAAEWATYGIRVNAVCPGNFMAHRENPIWVSATADAWKNHIPMRRFGEPEELAGIVVYLASDAASYTNGAVMLVDGGYTAV